MINSSNGSSSNADPPKYRRTDVTLGGRCKTIEKVSNNVKNEDDYGNLKC